MWIEDGDVGVTGTEARNTEVSTINTGRYHALITEDEDEDFQGHGDPLE